MIIIMKHHGLIVQIYKYIGLSKFSKDNAGCISKLNPVSEPTKRYIYLFRYSLIIY